MAIKNWSRDVPSEIRTTRGLVIWRSNSTEIWIRFRARGSHGFGFCFGCSRCITLVALLSDIYVIGVFQRCSKGMLEIGDTRGSVIWKSDSMVIQIRFEVGGT